ncbi:MAG: hypothetical protein PSV46_24955 [Reyranella sp.]|nr:hypothetical protein [Reyranella sp.]
MTARSIGGWPRWLAALLMGLLLVLALLIVSWFLRTCAPVEPAAGIVTLEAEPPPPAPPVPPDPTPVLKASLDEAAADGRKLAAELAALEADIKRRLAQCKPVEPPKPPPLPKPAPPPVVQAPPPPPPLPADRWAQKDLTMLQGCWRLGRDTRASIALGARSETCEVKAGRICFQGNGSGQRETTSVCPATGPLRCVAPVTARFGNDATLGTSQPVVRCDVAGTSWNGPENSLTCRRINDALAICRDRLGFEHEFRRE